MHRLAMRLHVATRTVMAQRASSVGHVDSRLAANFKAWQSLRPAYESGLSGLQLLPALQSALRLRCCREAVSST